MNFRTKCPKCGAIVQTNVLNTLTCRDCKTSFTVPQPCGLLRLYRMGNFMGSAAAFGVYINEQPIGYIGNRESLAFPLPYGTYQLHLRAKGQPTRTETPTMITLSPAQPVSCWKVSIETGVWKSRLNLTPAPESEMP